MPPEEDVNWSQELNKLPTVIRSVIIWFRLVGQIGVILVLVGFYIAKDMGYVSDYAALKRDSIYREVNELKGTSIAISDIQKRTLTAIEAHIKSTNRLASNLCYALRLSEDERRRCTEGSHE